MAKSNILDSRVLKMIFSRYDILSMNTYETVTIPTSDSNSNSFNFHTFDALNC